MAYVDMDRETHNIYVSCAPENSGVLCVSVKGQPLWVCPHADLPRRISAINDYLCVAYGSKVHLLTKEGENKKKLLNKVDLVDPIWWIDYDRSTQTLFVASYEKDIIRVFDVNT